MSITAIILTQGSELLNGSILDTNAQYLCSALYDRGVRVLETRCLPDDIDILASVFLDSIQRADIVISCGGLGPTRDDCTREACAKAFSCALEEHPQALKKLQEFYTRRNRTLHPHTQKMASIPSCAQLIDNPSGSAPCFSITQDSHTLYCFPGVPQELYDLFSQEIIPTLPTKKQPPFMVGCFGAGESRLMKHLRDIPQPITFRATRRGICVQFHAELTTQHKQHIEEQLAPFLYAKGHFDMALAIGEKLVERKETLSTAESCTSGGISAWITSIPGSSRYFLEGSAVYSNEAKMRTCNVPKEEIIQHGAVSKEVAISLANGMKQRAESTWAIAVTGIAGPGGATPTKPVGTVHIAVAGPAQTLHRRLQLSGNREQVLQSTMGYVMFLLYQQLV